LKAAVAHDVVCFYVNSDPCICVRNHISTCSFWKTLRILRSKDRHGIFIPCYHRKLFGLPEWSS